MIWDSILAMTVIDAAIIGAVGYALLNFLKHRASVADAGAKAGFMGILLGLATVALFHLVDLLVMHALPWFMPAAQAMSVMESLHLNFRWIVALIGVGCIAVGNAMAARKTSELIATLRFSQTRFAREVGEHRAAARSLAANEERFRGLYNKTPAMMHSIDAEGRLLSVSDHWLEVMGYGREEVLGRRSVEFLTEESRRFAIEEALPAFIRTGAAKNVPYRFVKKSGEVIDVLLSATSEKDASGKTQRSLAVLADVTERKRAEERLRESEERFRTIAGNLPGGVYRRVRDADGNLSYPYLSDRFWSIYDLDPETAAEEQDYIPNALHAEDRVRVLAAIEVSAESLEVYDCEYRFVGESAGKKWARSIAQPRREPNGDVVWDGIVFDITEQKRAEERSRADEARFRLLAEVTGEGIVVHHEGALVVMNRAYPNMLGYTQEELAGKDFFDLVAPECREAVRRHAVVEKSEDPLDFTFVRKDGSRFFAESVARNYEAEGKTFRVASIRDVTARKRAEDEIRRLNEALERRVEERTAELRDAQDELVKQEKFAVLGQLNATVSHELRNPLGTIRTSAAVIEEKVRGRDLVVARALERLYRSVGRCDRIIDEMLDYTRSTNLMPVPTRIDPWLTELLDEETLPEGMEQRRNLAAGAARLAMDRDRLRRAVVNLLANARDALAKMREDGGRRKPRISIGTAVKGGGLVLTVADNGPGMAPDVLDKAFEPLYSTKAFGVGLGLSVVKQIAEQHGGRVDLSSREGRGTTATLRLPLEKPRRRGGGMGTS